MNELSLYTFVTAGLCFVAYVLGVRRRQIEAANLSIQAVRRAHELAKALEKVVQGLRDAIAKHQTNVSDFHRQLETKAAVDLDDAERVVESSYELISDLVMSQSHISEQLGRLKELTQSRTDYLTGISNRRSFDEELNALLTRYQETGQGFSMASVDIDRFKAVNDTFGHAAGDNVLKHVVGLMSSYIRQTDSLARTGGEEFAILLANSDLADAFRVVERIRMAIEASTIQVGDRQVQVTISAGVVTAFVRESPDSLTRRADTILYRAKQSGGNQTRTGDPTSELLPIAATTQSSRENPNGNDPAPQILGEVATNPHTNACCSVGAR